MTRRHAVAAAIGGFMGSGKSTVGAVLAARLQLPFVDMDAVLEARFGPIAQQFETAGEATFRAREAALVQEVARGPAAVVSTGGGVFAKRGHRELLGTWGALVTLQAPFAVLAARVGEDPERPLFDGRAHALYAARAADYRDVDVVVAADRPVEEIVEEVATWLTRDA